MSVHNSIVLRLAEVHLLQDKRIFRPVNNVLSIIRLFMFFMPIFERSSTIKIGVERDNEEKTFGLACGMHHLGGQPTVRSVISLGIIDILFSCTPLLFTSETSDTAQPAVVPSEQSEAVKKRCAQNVVFNNVGPIT